MESLFETQISLFSSNNVISSNSNRAVNKCSKDYLSINESKYCGTISSYVDFYTQKLNFESNFLNIKFTSDDSLTRRGLWTKIKGILRVKIVF